jgi:hypothetical protein
MKTKIIAIILIFSTIFFLAFRQTSTKENFKTKTEKFVKKYSAEYSVSADNLYKSGFQYTLDNKTKHSWTKKETLKCKKSFKNKYNQTSYQRLYFAFYHYDTQQNGKAAFDSLTNCFPSQCVKIEQNKNIKAHKTIPAIYIINITEIITCHIGCEQIQDNWANIQKDLIDTFGDAQSIIITTGCGGPIEWQKKN